MFEDDGGLPYTLTEPLVYASVEVGAVLTVPAGFRTDLASIPRGLWNILPKSGGYDKAAVVHDWLYATHHGNDRAAADRVLREAMEVLGVGWWTRHLVYVGVRSGGWHAWGSYTPSAIMGSDQPPS